MSEDLEEEAESRGERQYEYEEPSLIDLEDLEGVSGGHVGGGPDIWPTSEWNDE